MQSIEEFLQKIEDSLLSKSFIKLTLSKPATKNDDLRNVYFRQIETKDGLKLSATFRYQTNDQVKNFDFPSANIEIAQLLKATFKNANLITKDTEYLLQTSKKGKITTSSTAVKAHEKEVSHDRKKEKRAPLDTQYLHELGVTTKDHQLIPKMADKYRQINKYLEIMDQLIESNDFKTSISIVDMGSGKGYLTFALYEFLQRKGFDITITGIELREELVSFCNEKAKNCRFEKLTFVAQRIEDFQTESVDILIALHACDTATDDALAKGILSEAKLIVCAPCCHKQVRQQVKGKTQENPLLKYGIFQERHFEMVTDTIRALLLEKNGYQSKIFEFVSNEHTRKNIMLIGSKTDHTDKSATEKIDAIKEENQIDFQYLEQLVNR